MSDLIERLRKHSDRSVGHWEDYAHATDSIVREAADALAAKDAEIARLREALLRIALKDHHTRRITPNPEGGLRGIGGMIATFALVGKNGSYVTDEEIISAYPDLAALTKPDAKSGEDNA